MNIAKHPKGTRITDSARGGMDKTMAKEIREDKKPFAKDWVGRNVFLAEHAEVDRNKYRVDKLLLLIAPYMGWKDISRVWVSDESTLGDFCLEKKQLKDLSKKLGFKVNDGDYLFVIAERIES